MDSVSLQATTSTRIPLNEMEIATHSEDDASCTYAGVWAPGLGYLSATGRSQRVRWTVTA